MILLEHTIQPNSSGKVGVSIQWIPHIYVGDPTPPLPTPRGHIKGGWERIITGNLKH